MDQENGSRGNWRALRIDFDTAVARLPETLQTEGFGVITQIDLQQTFKAKLGVDFRRYRIFGACNPKFALEAVQADPRIGLLLPCNIVLFEQDDRTVMLGVIDPLVQLMPPSADINGLRRSGGAVGTAQLGATEGPLADVARTVGERLARVAKAIDA